MKSEIEAKSPAAKNHTRRQGGRPRATSGGGWYFKSHHDTVEPPKSRYGFEESYQMLQVQVYDASTKTDR